MYNANRVLLKMNQIFLLSRLHMGVSLVLKPEPQSRREEHEEREGVDHDEGVWSQTERWQWQGQ